MRNEDIATEVMVEIELGSLSLSEDYEDIVECAGHYCGYSESVIETVIAIIRNRIELNYQNENELEARFS